MSVNINFTPPSNVDKWKSVENGDFMFLKGTAIHPIPDGLYRIFLMEDKVENNIFIVPMFNGPFELNMFHHVFQIDLDSPLVIEKVKNISISI